MFKEDHLSFRQRKYMKVKNIIGRALGGIGLVGKRKILLRYS